VSAANGTFGFVHATRRIWFPLHSNISYFETTGPRLDLAARVKEMAILAEELVFEPGCLDVNVTDDGLSSWWLPPGTLTDEEIRKRRSSPKGERFFFGIGAQKGPGQPAEAPTHAVIDGALRQGFFAEFDLSIREWGLEDVGWVSLGSIPDDAEAAAKQVAGEEDRREWPGRDGPTLSDYDFLDNRLKKDLNLDLARGAVMGTPVAVDELHAPMLEYKTGAGPSQFEGMDVPGASALRSWVPAFHTVPWKDIVALHDHDAIGAFREKLIEAEEAVAGLPEPERLVALKDFGLDELIKKLREHIRTPRGVAAEIGGSLALDLLSVGVPLLGTAAAGLKGLAELQHQQLEWTAVLLTLRGRAMPPQGSEV
jgi:hypothetical protein